MPFLFYGPIAVLAGVVALKLGQSFVGPLLTAVVVGIILSPLSWLWSRIGVRVSVAAFLSLAVVLLFVATLAFALEPYVSDIILRAPIIWTELRDTVEGARALVRGFDEMAQDVAAAVDLQSDTATEPQMAVPSLTDALFYAPQYLAQLMIFIGTLYFFLLTRRDVYLWCARQIDGLDRSTLDYAERRVATYFLTFTSINAGFGVIVTGVMQIFAMPSSVFWGFAAFLLNFIPYLGPMAIACSLLVTGVVVFDGALSFAPALVYMALNAIEGQFVTPALVGQRMDVNPLVVFLSLVFWMWLWGPIGGFIAIPILIWCLSIFENQTRGAINS